MTPWLLIQRERSTQSMVFVPSGAHAGRIGHPSKGTTKSGSLRLLQTNVLTRLTHGLTQLSPIFSCLANFRWHKACGSARCVFTSPIMSFTRPMHSGLFLCFFSPSMNTPCLQIYHFMYQDITFSSIFSLVVSYFDFPFVILVLASILCHNTEYQSTVFYY